MQIRPSISMLKVHVLYKFTSTVEPLGWIYTTDMMPNCHIATQDKSNIYCWWLRYVIIDFRVGQCDVTLSLSHFLHFRCPRFDYLTSRRYPYNKTMTELVDDIRREQHVEKLLKETSSTSRSTSSSTRYWDDAPRVVETSYYDVGLVRLTYYFIKHL